MAREVDVQRSHGHAADAHRIEVGAGSGRPVTAKCTQSVGVPSTQMQPLSAVRERMGALGVSELLAPVAVRGHDNDLAKRRKGTSQAPQPKGRTAVVIAGQDSHSSGPSR